MELKIGDLEINTEYVFLLVYVLLVAYVVISVLMKMKRLRVKPGADNPFNPNEGGKYVDPKTEEPVESDVCNFITDETVCKNAAFIGQPCTWIIPENWDGKCVGRGQEATSCNGLGRDVCESKVGCVYENGECSGTAEKITCENLPYDECKKSEPACSYKKLGFCVRKNEITTPIASAKSEVSSNVKATFFEVFKNEIKMTVLAVIMMIFVLIGRFAPELLNIFYRFGGRTPIPNIPR